MGDESPLLHKPERAAKRLDVSRTTVYKLMETGELRSIKIGRARRIPEAAIVEFIESQVAV